MFESLTLKNFRKVTDDTIHFQAGLNVIRGPNEASKSTRIEAIGYALFGARALREPLELVVTYDQKETTLFVALEFKINKDSIKVTRKKAGAELFVNGRLTVTGQTEVTKFCEALLGASADTTSKMMMASQSDLKGALADGPAAAVSLIEKLANFGLIDELVTLVQDKLPTGNTKALEGQIELLTGQLAEPLVDDTGPAKARHAELYAAHETAFARTETAQATRDIAHERLQPPLAAQKELERVEWAVTVAQQNLATAAGQTNTDVPGEVDTSEVPALTQAIEHAADRAKIQAIRTALDNLPACDEWDEGPAALQAAIDELGVQIKAADEAVADNKMARSEAAAKVASLKTKLINDKVCAFCQKDLADVPEVMAFNAKWTPQIAAAERELAVLQAVVLPVPAELRADRAPLLAVQQAAANRAVPYRNAAAYVTFDEKYVPARWTWTGPDLSQPVDTSAAKRLAAIKESVASRERLIGRQQAALAAHKKAEQALTDTEALVAPARAAAAGYADAKKVYDDCIVWVTTAESAQMDARNAMDTAKMALTHAQALYQQRLSARQQLVQQLETAQQLLQETGFNNALLKKLRTAKPQVADKLWGMVLPTISHYLSQGRGIESVVSRADNGFKVNGRSIGGLSGSAMDTFGLAVRIALTKTFLPNARFLVLDEASAACDDDREASMVGAVVSAGFEQVIWVSHSDAVEAFAQNVIQL